MAASLWVFSLPSQFEDHGLCSKDVNFDTLALNWRIFKANLRGLTAQIFFSSSSNCGNGLLIAQFSVCGSTLGPRSSPRFTCALKGGWGYRAGAMRQTGSKQPSFSGNYPLLQLPVTLDYPNSASWYIHKNKNNTEFSWSLGS